MGAALIGRILLYRQYFDDCLLSFTYARLVVCYVSKVYAGVTLSAHSAYARRMRFEREAYNIIAAMRMFCLSRAPSLS